jgi:hypothetical protein
MINAVKPERTYEFDVALSYAGEDRSYVYEVANHLRSNGVRVFYDEFYTAALWGQDLYVYLDNVYREQARFTVAFISQSYVSKPWPSHERQSAQARALNELGPYFLPVRFDDSVLPGLRPTVAYIDASRVTADQLGRLIIDKLVGVPGTSSPAPIVFGVPRSVEEQRQLLAERPEAWEFMLYASTLLLRRNAIDKKWRDDGIGYARRTGKYLDRKAAIEYVSSAALDAGMIIGQITHVLSSDAQETAFGRLGESGEPTMIEHIATRLIDVYEELLDWAANLRGMGVPSDFRNMIELAAQLARYPARQIREFVDYFVAQVEKIPERLLRGETVHLELTLKIELDQDVVSAVKEELDRLRNEAAPPK